MLISFKPFCASLGCIKMYSLILNFRTLTSMFVQAPFPVLFHFNSKQCSAGVCDLKSIFQADTAARYLSIICFQLSLF